MLVMANQNNGSRVELNMFKKWEKDGVIGYKIMVELMPILCGIKFVLTTRILP